MNPTSLLQSSPSSIYNSLSLLLFLTLLFSRVHPIFSSFYFYSALPWFSVCNPSPPFLLSSLVCNFCPFFLLHLFFAPTYRYFLSSFSPLLFCHQFFFLSILHTFSHHVLLSYSYYFHHSLISSHHPLFPLIVLISPFLLFTHFHLNLLLFVLLIWCFLFLFFPCFCPSGCSLHPLSLTSLLPFVHTLSFYPLSLFSLPHVASISPSLSSTSDHQQPRQTTDISDINGKSVLEKYHMAFPTFSPRAPLNHIQMSVSGIPSVNIPWCCDVISGQGTWRNWQIFSKTGSRGSLLWWLRWMTWAHLMQRINVSRSQDKKMDVVALWLLESERKFLSGQKHKPTAC